MRVGTLLQCGAVVAGWPPIGRRMHVRASQSVIEQTSGRIAGLDGPSAGQAEVLKTGTIAINLQRFLKFSCQIRRGQVKTVVLEKLRPSAFRKRAAQATELGQARHGGNRP